MHHFLHHIRVSTCLLAMAASVAACEQAAIVLPAQSQLDYSVAGDATQAIPMRGFVEFDERLEVAADTAASRCVQATYAFRFEYDTSVLVEFRDGKPGFCSYGAVMTKAFGVKIMTDEDYPVGTQLSPVIQFHQRDPHHAIFQIGDDYFDEKVSDLRRLEISCGRPPCNGSVERREVNPIT